jgi:hypothetical protein
MVLVTPTIADLTPDQRCRLRNAGISAQASIATVAVPENHMLWMVARHVEPAARVILSAAAGNEIDREDRAELAYMAREIRVAREFEGLREVEA